MSDEKPRQLAPAAGPLFQVLLSSLPLLALLSYFLYLAHQRPSEPCYSGYIAVNEIASYCWSLIPLQDLVFVFLIVALLWSTLAVYISLYMPRRQALIEEYLATGVSVVGNVYYNNDRSCLGRKADYGLITYPHPRLPCFIRRQVRVYERYTRERVTMLFLPDKSFSAQPRADLVVDRDIYQRNKNKTMLLAGFVWCWVAFSLLAPIYILVIFHQMEQTYNIQEWQPDHGSEQAIAFYVLLAAVVVPLASFMANAVAWSRYKHWMTMQHKILEEGERGDSEGGGWFPLGDDDNHHVKAYVPPLPDASPHDNAGRAID